MPYNSCLSGTIRGCAVEFLLCGRGMFFQPDSKRLSGAQIRQFGNRLHRTAVLASQQSYNWNIMREHFDIWSAAVIAITFALFVAALFTIGFTHDLLLEAGVLLVSIKLIQMAYKNSVNAKTITKELREIKALLQRERE